jgi:hypothetical protein
MPYASLFLNVWSAKCLNSSTVTRAHVPRQVIETAVQDKLTEVTAEEVVTTPEPRPRTSEGGRPETLAREPPIAEAAEAASASASYFPESRRADVEAIDASIDALDASPATGAAPVAAAATVSAERGSALPVSSGVGAALNCQRLTYPGAILSF